MSYTSITDLACFWQNATCPITIHHIFVSFNSANAPHPDYAEFFVFWYSCFSKNHKITNISVHNGFDMIWFRRPVFPQTCTQQTSYSSLNIDGLAQDCSNPSALTMVLLHYCFKPWYVHSHILPMWSRSFGSEMGGQLQELCVYMEEITYDQ